MRQKFQCHAEGHFHGRITRSAKVIKTGLICDFTTLNFHSVKINLTDDFGDSTACAKTTDSGLPPSVTQPLTCINGAIIKLYLPILQKRERPVVCLLKETYTFEVEDFSPNKAGLQRRVMSKI